MNREEIMKLFEEKFTTRLYDEYKQERTQDIKDFMLDMIMNKVKELYDDNLNL